MGTSSGVAAVATVESPGVSAVGPCFRARSLAIELWTLHVGLGCSVDATGRTSALGAALAPYRIHKPAPECGHAEEIWR